MLRGDRQLPEGQRPVFFLRYLTRRATGAYTALGQKSDKELRQMGDAAVTAALYAELGRVICGWEGLVDPDGNAVVYDASRLQELLDRVLTDGELWDLYFAGGRPLTPEDACFFGLPQSTPSGGSASPLAASAGPDSAQTSQEVQAPSSTSAPAATDAAASSAASPE